MVARKNAFKPFQVDEMKMNNKTRQKMKWWNANFHKWKEIWIYKRYLNQFPFPKKTHQEKKQLWWKTNENAKNQKKNHENKQKDERKD